jgi:hypothetical protein
LATFVESGRENQDVAFAHLLIHQQRSLIGEFRDGARAERVDADRLVELDVVPAVVLEDGRVRGIEPGRAWNRSPSRPE